MSNNPVVQSYKTRYSDLNFERLGLFKLVSDTFHSQEVLYPGCSIHITPSFLFPCVVYVDKSPAAREFFAKRDLLMEFITRNRVYRRKPYVQFIHQDFSEPLPLADGSFDLLISLFAVHPTSSCNRYLRKGGMMLTNQGTQAGTGLKLICTIRFQQGRYQISRAHPHPREPRKTYLRQASRGLEYAENETYFVFKKD